MRLPELGFDLGYLLFGKPSAVIASAWLDWDLLEEVREGVDEWCTAKNVLLSDSKYRQIVRLLYEHFAATGKIEDAHLSEVLRMVA